MHALDSLSDGEPIAFEVILPRLSNPSAYRHTVETPVVIRETHISWILLAGSFAYKIKKPIRTDFLDYTTLDKRHHACCEELRLGARTIDQLYEAVVPICIEHGKVHVDGDSQPIEFAVRMKRFPEGSLLSERIESGSVSRRDLEQLAVNIAAFHHRSKPIDGPSDDFVEVVLNQALDNIWVLKSEPEFADNPLLLQLEAWTRDTFCRFKGQFELRGRTGYIRECHGDLHCDNIVWWNSSFSPFDGIEFNPTLSSIDVLSDVAFLVMDLHFRGHSELAATCLNSYLEETGDYYSLSLFRWYLVYRALVRAKVSLIRARQLTHDPTGRGLQLDSVRKHVQLAGEQSIPPVPRLWITHGVSGSGKTVGSQRVIEKACAIRLRSDVERKRLFRRGEALVGPSTIGGGIYDSTATEATYTTLWNLSREVLHAGFSVVVDATFLKHSDRQRFQQLAQIEELDFGILDFQAEEKTLVDRIEKRLLAQQDASEANVDVLKHQLASQEPLTDQEELLVCNQSTSF